MYADVIPWAQEHVGKISRGPNDRGVDEDWFRVYGRTTNILGQFNYLGAAEELIFALEVAMATLERWKDGDPLLFMD